jgi:hypothetical protein
MWQLNSIGLCWLGTCSWLLVEIMNAAINEESSSNKDEKSVITVGQQAYGSSVGEDSFSSYVSRDRMSAEQPF